MLNQKRIPLLLAAAGAGAWLAMRALRGNYNFAGKNVLITGGSRGLGLVLARQLAQEGAHVAICARDPDELERAHDELAQLGGHVLSTPCDVTDPAMVERMVAGIRDQWGPIDVLINNAGTIVVGPVETMTLEDFEEGMRVSFWAALHTTLAVLPEMRRRQSGRIVNITSIGGKIAVPHLLPYDAGKFALVGLSEGLRSELRKDGIVVTTVVPGLMRTGSPRNADFKGQHQAEYTWFKISDALPIVSINAERAARQIIRACRHGDAEITLTIPAWLADKFHGLFPGLTADILGLVNAMLPGPGGIGTARAKGKDSETPLTHSWITALDAWAAERNNEFAPGEPRDGHGRRRFSFPGE